uniref:Uncharacterized protein n=1 Tax=Cucumis melo TaxID=3656 RepID=A0A9I9EMZ6_CUCME
MAFIPMRSTRIAINYSTKVITLGMTIFRSVLSCICPCCFCVTVVIEFALALINAPILVMKWFTSKIPC